MLPPRPDQLPWPEDLLDPQPRRIHRTSARVDKHIVQEAAERTAQKRRHHGDPEVIPAGGPYLRAIADRVAHEARTEVARDVDRVARFPAESAAEAEDQEEERQREPFVGFGDAVVAFLRLVVDTLRGKRLGG